MTDHNSQFFAILTAAGEAKQANADALGVPWTFSQMGVGDANGADPIPSRTQTALINECRRAPLNQLMVDPANANVIIAEQVIPPDVGGWWIREIGLYDADGDLVAVANCAPSFKPLLSQGTGKTQVVRLNIVVTSTADVQLKIDPAVVLATRAYVDGAILEVLPKNKAAGEYTRVKINGRGVVISGDSPETLAANGITDAYTKTQVDELFAVQAAQVQELFISGPLPGASRSRLLITAASSTGACTADYLTLQGSGGRTYRTSNLSANFNLAMVGVNGMDIGQAPVNGYVACYAIFNPTTKEKGVLWVDTTSILAPEVYSGAEFPAGYTASCLLTVVPTNASRQIKPVQVRDRKVSILLTTVYASTVAVSNVVVSVSAVVPKNAIEIHGELSLLSSVATTGNAVVTGGSIAGIGQQVFSSYIPAGGAGCNYASVPMDASQNIVVTMSVASGTWSGTTYISGYSI